VYIIGGTEEDGELLSAEQADDLITRFEHEQSLFGNAKSEAITMPNTAATSSYGIKSRPVFQHSACDSMYVAHPTVSAAV
jgi:hypothetical protein